MDHPMMSTEKPPAIDDTDDAEVETPRNSKGKTFLTKWKDFGENTSMHGLGRAVHSKQMWKRIIWSILVIGAACIAGKNLYSTVVSYFSYPVSTTIELKMHRTMHFPAVTICNLNPAPTLLLNQSIVDAVKESFEKGQPPKKQEQAFNLHMNKVYGINSISSDDYVEKPFHNISDMIVDCYFNMDYCGAVDFDEFENFKYGKCYTFNAAINNQDLLGSSDEVYSDAKIIKRPGNKNGLILELDVMNDNYLPFISTAGIKVLVHPRDQRPFPEDSGIIVGTGKATSIGIRKRVVTRQPKPWGRCVNPKEVNSEKINMFGRKYRYTEDICHKTCYQRTLVSFIGCCDENYPCPQEILKKIASFEGMDYIRICNAGDKTEAAEMKRIRERYYEGRLDCMSSCKPACKDVTYVNQYATGSWPGPEFIPNLLVKANKSMAWKGPKFPAYPTNMTKNYVKENFLRIEVYFETFEEEIILTKPAYDWNSLLGDLGGQLGLWLGFSLMTAVEIIELLYDLSSLLCRRVMCQGKKSSASI